MSQIPPLSAPALLKKRFGTLEVRDAGVAWTEVPDGGAPPAIGAVLVPFERVKSQAVNAATSNKVMLRLNLAESLADGTDAYTFNFPGSLDEAAAARDAFKDVIGAALKRAAAKSAQAMSVQSAMPTQEELSLRVELLSSDRALAKLHRELVMGELCTEEDFWELRQDVLANFKLQKSQKRGLPHGAAPESMAEAAAGAGKKLSLSKEKIQEIFAQNPTVYRAYQENVPNKLSEKEFWTRYVRDQMQRGGVGKDPDLLFGSISEAVEEDQVNQPKPSLPFIDLGATAEDNVKDYEYGNKPDQTMVPGANQTRMELLRRLNKMSSMVLDQTTQKTRAPANKGDVISKEILLDDLSGESTERGIELRVPDQTRYFPSQADGDGDATGLAPVSTDDISAFIDRSRNLGATTENVYFDSDVCLEVVDRLTRILDRGDRSGSRHHVSRDITSLHLGVNEALRHFWGAFPPKTAKQREKLSRVEQVLRTQIEQMKGHGSAGAAFKYDLDAAETALRALEYMTS